MEEPDFEEFFDGLTPEETEEVIQFLVDNGAAEWDGMDEYGERMFKFNMKILSSVMPSLHEQIMEELDQSLIDLFQKGLIDIEYNENLEATFHVTEGGKKVLKEMGIDYLIDEEE